MFKKANTTIGTIKLMPIAMILLHDTHFALPGCTLTAPLDADQYFLFPCLKFYPSLLKCS
jgi:hypothetical protein